jgi:two-component system cell cycle response regulator
MPARILIIEDNPTSLELMTYLLNAYGHTRFTARDGAEGLAVARREKPDLIVCDIQLPGMDGHEVAREIKASAELRDIPLVAVTAFAMVGDRDRIMAGGFDGYISKPIDPETFVTQVEAFLRGDQRSGRNTPDGKGAGHGDNSGGG